MRGTARKEILLVLGVDEILPPGSVLGEQCMQHQKDSPPSVVKVGEQHGSLAVG